MIDLKLIIPRFIQVNKAGKPPEIEFYEFDPHYNAYVPISFKNYKDLKHLDTDQLN